MTAQRVLVDKRSTVSILILILTIAFLGAVVFTLIRHRGNVRQTESIKAANAARESFEAARDLVGLDDEEAQEKLTLGKESLDRAVRLGLSTRRAKELEDLYSSVRLQILKIVSIETRGIHKIEKGRVSDLMFDHVENRLVFLDTVDGKLVALESGPAQTPIGQKKIIATDISEEYSHVILTESLIGVWGGSGFEVSGRNGGVGGSASFEKDWEIADVFGFANWVYALSSEEDQIFKFYNTDKEFAESAWLGADISVGEGSLLGINGDVYVWSDTLYKFTKGRETDFYLRLDLETPLEDVQDLAVWPGCTFLYLLDSGHGRILQVTKEGLLENQYVGKDLKAAKALAVNSGETKAFVLTDREILEVSLE